MTNWYQVDKEKNEVKTEENIVYIAFIKHIMHDQTLAYAGTTEEELMRQLATHCRTMAVRKDSPVIDPKLDDKAFVEKYFDNYMEDLTIKHIPLNRETNDIVRVSESNRSFLEMIEQSRDVVVGYPRDMIFGYENSNH